MNPDSYDIDDRYPADTELKFVGAITASVTHELNNIISILNQTGGLLDDMLAGAEQDIPIKPERLRKIADRIRIQTERGINIIKRLNSFAHSGDQSFGSFDLNELMENLGALLERFVSLRGATLTMQLSSGSLELVNNPLAVQQIIFLSLKIILRDTQKNEVVIISTNGTETGRKIRLLSKADRECQAPDISELEPYAEGIDAKFVSGQNEAGAFIEIDLPRTAKGG